MAKKDDALRLRIEKPLKERLRRIAKSDKRSMSNLVVVALTEFADKHEPKSKETHNP